jgi:hypothetical protein
MNEGEGKKRRTECGQKIKNTPSPYNTIALYILYIYMCYKYYRIIGPWTPVHTKCEERRINFKWAPFLRGRG